MMTQPSQFALRRSKMLLIQLFKNFQHMLVFALSQTMSLGSFLLYSLDVQDLSLSKYLLIQLHRELIKYVEANQSM